MNDDDTRNASGGETSDMSDDSPLANPDRGMMITDRNDDEHTIGGPDREYLADPDAILFLPAEPGAVAAFFAQFRASSSNSAP